MTHRGKLHVRSSTKGAPCESARARLLDSYEPLFVVAMSGKEGTSCKIRTIFFCLLLLHFLLVVLPLLGSNSRSNVISAPILRCRWQLQGLRHMP